MVYAIIFPSTDPSVDIRIYSTRTHSLTRGMTESMSKKVGKKNYLDKKPVNEITGDNNAFGIVYLSGPLQSGHTLPPYTQRPHCI